MTAKPRNRGITVVRTSNNASRPADLEQLAREAAAVICKELNAREFAKLGEPRTWFDLQGAAAYLAVSEQTYSAAAHMRYCGRAAKSVIHDLKGGLANDDRRF